jgi:hypothetical protein
MPVDVFLMIQLFGKARDMAKGYFFGGEAMDVGEFLISLFYMPTRSHTLGASRRPLPYCIASHLILLAL